MHDTTLTELLWRAIIIACPDSREHQQAREQLTGRKTEVLDVLHCSAEAEDRLLAACAIVRMDKSRTEVALPVLIDGLKSDASNFRVLAATACAELGPIASPAVPALIDVLENHDEFDEDDSIACNRAIGALEAIGATSEATIPALTELLRKIGPAANMVEMANAIRTADALGAIGPSATAAIAVLHECLDLDEATHDNDLNRLLRIAASEAIWRICGESSLALHVAMRMLEDEEEWWLRCHAVDLLNRLGPAAQPAISVLRRSCDDLDENVRRRARTAIANITQGRRQQSFPFDSEEEQTDPPNDLPF